MNKLWVVIVLLVTLISCKTEETAVPIAYDYVVLDSGASWIYSYDSLAFNDNSNTVDTFELFLKEQISGNIQLQTERYLIMDRFVGTDTLEMTQRESAFLLLTSNSFERIDQNQRRIKLIFPVQDGRVWNGNAWNDLGRQNFSLKLIPQLQLASGKSYTEIAEVNEANTVNVIETNFERSWYARGIGLIKREDTRLQTQSGKTSGYKIVQSLLHFRP
ncbi:hypothetical protein MASR2M44_27750 [Bacteroidota bacterium]